MRWLKKLALSIGGGILSAVTVYPATMITEVGTEMVCHGGERLSEGKALMLAAIDQRQPQLFTQAKAALEDSAKCRVPEATFLLGLMHCRAMGVPHNAALGEGMLAEAGGRELRLMIKYLITPTICQQKFKTATATFK